MSKSRLCGAVCIALLGVIVAGCGSGSGNGSAVQAGPISVTRNGSTVPVSSLAITSTIQLSMMPVNDSLNAGVDWIVTCGGSPVNGSITNGACGTLAPAHTADGGITQFTAPSIVPIGTTITITASVTSNTSQKSSVGLTVLPLPVAISLSGPAPNSLVVNQQVGVAAEVENDVAFAGVAFTATCGSIACGSFAPPIGNASNRLGIATYVSGSTYTAPSVVPAGGTVTLTATSLTDSTKSVSQTVQITSQSESGALAISVSPTSFYVSTANIANRTFHVSATVINDPASAGVDWSLSCSSTNCGTFTAHTASGAPMTYLAPANGIPDNKVIIKASATANSAVSATIVGTILPTPAINVTIAPSFALPATLTAGTLTTLEATVTPTPDTAGVDWTATCGSVSPCGSFNLSPAHTASGDQIIYTAPNTIPTGGIVTITASSSATTPSNSAIATTEIVAPLPSIALTQSPPSSTMVSGTQISVSATVTNDVTPGGVVWTLTCNSVLPNECGTIAPYQTTSGGSAIYTAPPVTTMGTSVTITATSVAYAGATVSATPIAITPATDISVSFVPSLPSQVAAGATVNLLATVNSDSTNAGVDWQVCANDCGFFTIKPAVPAVLATATTPFVPEVPAVTATSVTAWPNGLALPYTAPLQLPTSGTVAVLASAHVDTSKANSGTMTIASGPIGAAISGVVQAGTQAVVGAIVTLYAAGTSGYGSFASPIASAPVTDKNGRFIVPAGYTCPQQGSQMYLVATGGRVGTNTENANLSMMTALGSCSNLGSGPFVVNEITTVASAYATSSFASNDALTGNSSYQYLGTSSSNLLGLANAFAAVNNLVDISTGQVRSIVPSGNAAVPYSEIDSLADMLNACTASSGGQEGDTTACGALFTGTDLLGTGTYGASIAPSDTLQAAFNIAQHPVTTVLQYGYLLSVSLALVTPASPFQPVLTTAPNDWAISLHYTGGGGLSSASVVGSFAEDATGNLWITDSKAGSAIEWNPVGASLSPPTGFPAGGGPIAIDANGNVWISGDGALTELTSLGNPVPGSPFSGVPGGGADIAIDALGDIWIPNTSGVNEFSNLGTLISPASGYGMSGLTNFVAIGINSSNDVLTSTNGLPEGASFSAQLTNPGGQFLYSNGPAPFQPQVAGDSAGNFWGVEGFLYEIPPFGSEALVTFFQTGGLDGQFQDSLDVGLPMGLAFDGAGTLWVAGEGYMGGGKSAAPGLLPVHPSGTYYTAINYVSQALAAGTVRAAVDITGNVWVLLSDSSVVEYVGVGMPVVTPLALGVKNHKLAATP